ncbi:MAG: PepSY domain-containing protein, partial [Pseudolabrys sp.]
NETCLTRAEQRAAVVANRAISLAQAIKLLRQYRKHSEVVRARLCRRDDKLVYVLTLLGRSGKVVEATVDAVSGEFHAGP